MKTDFPRRKLLSFSQTFLDQDIDSTLLIQGRVRFFQRQFTNFYWVITQGFHLPNGFYCLKKCQRVFGKALVCRTKK